MGSAMGVPFDSYTPFDWACFASGVIVPLPALYGAVTALWTRALAPAGRRPEPTVAALLGNACWFLWGWTEHQEEPLVLNAWGGGIQLVALLAFLLLCTPDQRMRALRGRISHAAMYLAGTLTLGLGINRIQLWFRASGILLGFYQIVCTFAGVLSGAAPLLTLLTENPDAVDELLTPRFVLVLNTAHGLLWSARGMVMGNIFMLTQNLVGGICSAFQLLLPPWPQLPLLPHDYVIIRLGSYQVVLQDLRLQLPLPQPLPALPAPALTESSEHTTTSEDGSEHRVTPAESLKSEATATRSATSSTERSSSGSDPPKDTSTGNECSPSTIIEVAGNERVAVVDIPPRRSNRLLKASQGTRNAPTSGGESSSKTPKARSSSKKSR